MDHTVRIWDLISGAYATSIVVSTDILLSGARWSNGLLLIMIIFTVIRTYLWQIRDLSSLTNVAINKVENTDDDKIVFHDLQENVAKLFEAM